MIDEDEAIYYNGRRLFLDINIMRYPSLGGTFINLFQLYNVE